MKTVFFGSPAAALPSFEALLAAGHSIELVVTQPDRPAGRGRRLVPSRVKAFAVARRIPVIEPEKIRKDEAARERIVAARPDANIVVAYGQIIPHDVYFFPRHHSLNVHFSLLPNYPGAAPVQWTLIEEGRFMAQSTGMKDSVFYRNSKKSYPTAVRGEGIYIYDSAGKRYIDGSAGAAVVGIGHGVKEITEAMARQAEKISFAHGSQFTSEASIELAAELTRLAPEGMTRVYFLSGGSEAVETAVILARQYQMERGKTEKFKMISHWTSYHGNTLGALALSGSLRAKAALFAPHASRSPHRTALLLSLPRSLYPARNA